ncbi:hypothetical protein ACBJ59_61915 [Nonomuraea sp. MTCD27]|uniref:hypothetical protein n=1 Tax=Nonomuraea sp. MTCD27 TaxID=1676747 RepID=UPI0035C26E90
MTSTRPGRVIAVLLSAVIASTGRRVRPTSWYVPTATMTSKDAGPVAMSHGVDLTGLAAREAQAASHDDGGEAAP